jgi:hypothetical protein
MSHGHPAQRTAAHGVAPRGGDGRVAWMIQLFERQAERRLERAGSLRATA